MGSIKGRPRPPADLLPMQAKFIASVIRDAMEDFHCQHLTDEQMRQLNPIIRNAIFTALRALRDMYDTNGRIAAHARTYVEYALYKVPSYWEEPTLLANYQRAIEEGANAQKAASAANVEDDRIVTEQELCSNRKRSGLLPYHRSTIWRMCEAGEFPKPIQLSRHRKGWWLSSVRTWAAKRETDPIQPRKYFGRSSDRVLTASTRKRQTQKGSR